MPPLRLSRTGVCVPRSVADATPCGVGADSISARGGAVKTAPYGASWSDCLLILPVCRGEHCSSLQIVVATYFLNFSQEKLARASMLAPTRHFFGNLRAHTVRPYTALFGNLRAGHARPLPHDDIKKAQKAAAMRFLHSCGFIYTLLCAHISGVTGTAP